VAAVDSAPVSPVGPKPRGLGRTCYVSYEAETIVEDPVIG